MTMSNVDVRGGEDSLTLAAWCSVSRYGCWKIHWRKVLEFYMAAYQ